MKTQNNNLQDVELYLEFVSNKEKRYLRFQQKAEKEEKRKKKETRY